MSLKFGKNQVMIKKAIVITPATIWFSVMLEANIPSEIYAILNRKNPSRVMKIVGRYRFPKKLSRIK